mgnify:CR=1 FL=1
MAYTKQDIGKKCPNCLEGKLVLNPKTNKVFCSDRCWLKDKPDEYGILPPAGKKEPNWDKIRKESHENMELLNAKNNATLLLVKAMEQGLSLEEALNKFDETTQKIYDIGKE